MPMQMLQQLLLLLLLLLLLQLVLLLLLLLLSLQLVLLLLLLQLVLLLLLLLQLVLLLLLHRPRATGLASATREGPCFACPVEGIRPLVHAGARIVSDGILLPVVSGGRSAESRNNGRNACRSPPVCQGCRPAERRRSERKACRSPPVCQGCRWWRWRRVRVCFSAAGSFHWCGGRRTRRGANHPH